MIGFVEAIRNGFEQYASARGRASRAEYWWWVLFNAVVQLLLGDSLLGAIAVVGLIVPSIAVLLRRLHDSDRSGWFLLIVLIPAIGFLILIAVLARPGTPGSNRYGAPRVPAAPSSNPWQSGGSDPAGGTSGGWDAPPPPAPPLP